LDEALDIAIQVARGLSEAHGKGVFHRDIKPGNIMITTGGMPRWQGIPSPSACFRS
jgi:serine/threonine protein kinase